MHFSIPKMPQKCYLQAKLQFHSLKKQLLPIQTKLYRKIPVNYQQQQFHTKVNYQQVDQRQKV